MKKEKGMGEGNIVWDLGINMVEEEIEDVIFERKELVSDGSFRGWEGGLWWIVEMWMGVGGVLGIVMGGGMG